MYIRREKKRKESEKQKKESKSVSRRNGTNPFSCFNTIEYLIRVDETKTWCQKKRGLFCE